MCSLSGAKESDRVLGQVIHGYRIDRALSGDKGGFGDVYFASHVDSGAEAVVKVLKPEMSAQRDIVARFFNEARAAASVHHPGVVQIHNVGYHGDRAYLLMERLHGDDLETRLAGGPLPVDRAIVFVRQAAGAVGAAHDRGIVHRDLKPANLFVVADPDVVGGERVKVLDFGIAKLSVDSGAGKTQGVFGTPAYMSPEQCASTGAVDPRSDLYSLGCIFYELVCGRPPFGQGGIELIASHLRDAPMPPRAIAPWVPPAVEAVILRLLEKQPERRPPTCAALIAALDEAAAASGLGGASMPQLPAGTSPSLPPASTGGSWPGPHPTTLGAAAGASTMPVRGRSGGRGAWFAIGAVVAVAGAIAVVLAMPSRHPAGNGSGSDGSGSIVAGSGSAGSGSAGSGGAGNSTGVAGTGSSGSGTIAGATPDNRGTDNRAADDRGTESRGADNRAADDRAADNRGTDHQAADNRAAGDNRTGDNRTGDRAPSDPSAAPSAADSGAGQFTEPVVASIQLAEKLNEQGKDRMYANDYEHARQLFSQAAARDPQPKYFLNLATAYIQLGYFDPAATVLREAVRRSPTPEQAEKVRKLFGIVADQAQRQGIAIHPPITAAELGRPTALASPPAPDAPATGQTQDEIAERLNEEGKELMYADRYSAAANKFQEAVARVPKAKFLINLCQARVQEGKLDEAVAACQAMREHDPNQNQLDRADKLLRIIKAKAKSQGLEVHGVP